MCMKRELSAGVGAGQQSRVDCVKLAGLSAARCCDVFVLTRCSYSKVANLRSGGCGNTRKSGAALGLLAVGNSTFATQEPEVQSLCVARGQDKRAHSGFQSESSNAASSMTLLLFSTLKADSRITSTRRGRSCSKP